MSILSWFLKSKKEMAKPDTKRVKLGKYTISSHAQNRTVDPTRSLRKKYMVENLYQKPLYKTDIKLDSFGQPSYGRVGKNSFTWINPETNVVTSTKKTNKKDIKRGEKYGYKPKK